MSSTICRSRSDDSLIDRGEPLFESCPFAFEGIDRLLEPAHGLGPSGQRRLSRFELLESRPLQVAALLEVALGGRVDGGCAGKVRLCLFGRRPGRLDHRRSGAVGLGDLDAVDRHQVAFGCHRPQGGMAGDQGQGGRPSLHQEDIAEQMTGQTKVSTRSEPIHQGVHAGRSSDLGGRRRPPVHRRHDRHAASSCSLDRLHRLLEPIDALEGDGVGPAPQSRVYRLLQPGRDVETGDEGPKRPIHCLHLAPGFDVETARQGGFQGVDSGLGGSNGQSRLGDRFLCSRPGLLISLAPRGSPSDSHAGTRTRPRRGHGSHR